MIRNKLFLIVVITVLCLAWGNLKAQSEKKMQTTKSPGQGFLKEKNDTIKADTVNIIYKKIIFTGNSAESNDQISKDKVSNEDQSKYMKKATLIKKEE